MESITSSFSKPVKQLSSSGREAWLTQHKWLKCLRTSGSVMLAVKARQRGLGPGHAEENNLIKRTGEFWSLKDDRESKGSVPRNLQQGALSSSSQEQRSRQRGEDRKEPPTVEYAGHMRWARKWAKVAFGYYHLLFPSIENRPIFFSLANFYASLFRKIPGLKTSLLQSCELRLAESEMHVDLCLNLYCCKMRKMLKYWLHIHTHTYSHT